jgi:hypothetical protein
MGIMHLTYRDSPPHTSAVSGASASEAGAPEIEVTPAMVAAGEDVIFSYRDDLMASSLAVEVYRAMEQARKYPKES